ncbi:hypothetical protein ES708_13370 [subsurface metagenome]
MAAEAKSQGIARFDDGKRLRSQRDFRQCIDVHPALLHIFSGAIGDSHLKPLGVQLPR